MGLGDEVTFMVQLQCLVDKFTCHWLHILTVDGEHLGQNTARDSQLCYQFPPEKGCNSICEVAYPDSINKRIRSRQNTDITHRPGIGPWVPGRVSCGIPEVTGTDVEVSRGEGSGDYFGGRYASY